MVDVPAEWVDTMDLLRKCTRLDPNSRITARGILQHPFIVKNADKISQVLHIYDIHMSRIAEDQ